MPKNETKQGTGSPKVEEKETTGNPKEAVTPTTSKDVVPAEDSEMVEVSKADLAAFVRRLDGLEKDNKRLLSVADKGRMHQLNEAEKKDKKMLPTVKVSRIGGPTGKMVLAWNTTQNESYVDGNRTVERQEIEIFYVDGTSEKMPLVTFYRKQNKDTVGTIVSRTRDEDGGSEMLKLEMPGGDILEIDLKFVN